MTPWTAAQLMDVWERGARLHPLDRTLLALTASSDSADAAQLADLPVGELRRRALALGCALFGTTLEGEAVCDGCGERHEVSPPVDAILTAPLAEAGPVQLALEGHRVTLRAVTARDLCELTHGTIDAHALLARCVLEATHDGMAVPLGELPPALIGALAEAAAALDPNADTVLGVICVRCGRGFELMFDPGEFLWCELASRARRLLYQVHVLARHYGWSERDILGMSDRRREGYLAMVGA